LAHHPYTRRLLRASEAYGEGPAAAAATITRPHLEEPA
jgi:hypothetical protein